MAVSEIGGSTTANKKKKTREDQLNVPLPNTNQVQSGNTTAYLQPYLGPSSNDNISPLAQTAAPSSGLQPYSAPGSGTGSGMSSDYVGNQFLDNPASAVNNIMQGLGLSVSNNSPFYNAMSQLAPGLEWLQYFTNCSGIPGTFLGNVQGWFNGGTGATLAPGGGQGPFVPLASAVSNLLSGGSTPDLQAMLDNMNPHDITQAILAMIETGGYGGMGSRVRQGLEARAADVYNQFLGQQPTIEAGLGQGQTIADAFLKFLNSNNLLGSLGL
jgi:hypothetical protein